MSQFCHTRSCFLPYVYPIVLRQLTQQENFLTFWSLGGGGGAQKLMFLEIY